MISDDEFDDAACIPKSCLFTLALKIMFKIIKC